MFTKLPNHLRPFLGRVQASPDLFTANPSLLHHLPQQNGSSGASHGLVQQGQSSASTSGGGSAGRAGYQGGSAGSGGGYTGHARAFTSLQHTSTDPSSGIRDDDSRKSKSKRRSSISFKPPPYRPITIIEEPTSLSSRLKLLSQNQTQNSKTVEVKDINWKDLSPRARKRELEDVVDAAINTSRTGSRSGLGLARTRSIDLYAVGVGIPRPQLRAYSSISPSISELDISELRPSSRTATVASTATTSTTRLSSPNRVQMDLAGLDIPRRSYATASSASATDESIEYPSTTTTDETDRRIYSAIYHATKDSRRDFCNSLIAHYRSPRDAPSPHPEIEEHLPRPTGYSVGTYNACLAALLAVRRVGESIAPLLEIYNEMLEREILPNGRTYVSVIQALCLREKDVQAAVDQATESKKWGQFRSTNLGLKYEGASKEDRAVLQGYLAEANFDSAYNLFKGILSVQEQSTPGGFYRFHPNTYSYLLDALAIQHTTWEHVEKGNDIFNHAHSTDTSGARMLYKHMFRLLAKSNKPEAVSELWERFMKEGEEGGKRMRDWKDILPGTTIENREVQVEGFQREVWSSAIAAFISTGNIDKGMALLEEMLSHKDGVNLDKAPRAKGDTFGLAILALVDQDHLTQASDLFTKSKEYGGLRAVDMGKYLDSLVYMGEWKLALDTYIPYLADRPEGYNADVRRVRRIYASILGSARASNDLEVLSNIPKLMSTGTYMLDTDLAITHIRVLLQHSQFDQIASILNNFGPLMLRLEHDIRYPMNGLLQEIVSSDITLVDILNVLTALARQKIHPSPNAQSVIGGIISKYISARPIQLEQEGWNQLLYVFSRTAAPALDHGEYDEALEAFMVDLKEHAPETLRLDAEGRLVTGLAERLFGRFGSDRTTSFLAPLVGEAETKEILQPLYEQSVPELVYDSSSDPSSPSSLPTDPASPIPASAPEQAPRRLNIDDSLSRRIDGHSSRPDGRNQITAQRAYTELRSALSQNRIAHPESLSRLLLTLAREGDEPRVLELYSLAQNLIAQTSNPKTQAAWWKIMEDSMLISQCHLGHLEQAGLHRHRLVERGLAPSADAYATMIASSKDTTDDAQVARELWDESVQMGVRPHLYLYNTVISKLSKARKAEDALEMFGQMKERGVRPSSVTYGAVINACCRVGDAESAETLFNEMSSQPNFKPRVPPFNTMMQFYLQTRPSREKVLHYYTALRQSGVQPSVHTYKLLLDAYHTIAPLDLTSMERTFAELCTDRSLKVQGTHWASLITAYGISNSDVTKATEVFDLIATHPANTTNALSEPVVWEAILNVLATKGTLEQMEEMRIRMESSGTKPTAYVYNVLISGYARHNSIEKARAVFESMQDSYTGMSAPNNHPHPHPQSHGHGQGQQVGGVYREPSTYETMIRAEISTGTREAAEGIVRRMEERGYPAAVYFKARSLLDNGSGASGGQGGGVQGMGSYFPVPSLGMDGHGQQFAQ